MKATKYSIGGLPSPSAISQKMFPIILGTVVQRYELFEVILQLRHEATAPVAGLGMNPVQHGFNLLDNTLFGVLGHVGIMSVENEQQNFSSDVTLHVQTFEMTVEDVKICKAPGHGVCMD